MPVIPGRLRCVSGQAAHGAPIARAASCEPAATIWPPWIPPALAAQWDPEKNGTLTPEHVLPGSGRYA